MDKSEVHILLVDDEEDILTSLKTHLELDGYCVDVASTAAAALEKVRTTKVNMVLTDINMPEMDGIELLEEIKKIHGDVIVIMITAYTSLMKVANSRFHGAADYVLKPFRDLAELDEVIETAYRHIVRWDKVMTETIQIKHKSQ
jgi:DNA-binding NtrC family response regulator